MKIILVNKFLYPRGGAETYTFSLGKILEEHGHTVQYFGMYNPKNIVGNSLGVYVNEMDFSTGIINNLHAPFRIIYNFQAAKLIRKLLEDFKPDVVHINNIQFHITPSIIIEINKWRKRNHKECKIIYTAHDYQLVCPSHGLFDINIKPCERCLDGHYIHCVQTKCIKNSRAKSMLGTLDAYFWKYNLAYSHVDMFICCSNFLKKKLDTQSQFRGKTVTIQNFKDIIPNKNVKKKDYIIEFGKLCKDKGTETLLEVAKRNPDKSFKFVGYGPSAELMKDIPNVEYLGFKEGEELYTLIAEASVSVCPSEWYENCPFSVIESISLGTPVVGTRMGGIPELITEGVTGELFAAGDIIQLEEAINKIMLSMESIQQYSNNCMNVQYETSETYYQKIMRIYQNGELSYDK